MHRLIRVVVAVVLVLAPALLSACGSCPGKRAAELGCRGAMGQTSCNR